MESNVQEIAGYILSRTADRLEIRTPNNNTIEFHAPLWMEATNKYQYYERVRGAYVKEMNLIFFCIKFWGSKDYLESF